MSNAKCPSRLSTVLDVVSILLVSAETPLAGQLTRNLKNQGYCVPRVPNDRQAVQFLESQPTDIIILLSTDAKNNSTLRILTAAIGQRVLAGNDHGEGIFAPARISSEQLFQLVRDAL